jgi:hypothetical protein
MFRTFLRVLEATLHGFPQGAMQKCSVGSMLGGVALGRAVQAWAGYVRGPVGARLRMLFGANVSDDPTRCGSRGRPQG